MEQPDLELQLKVWKELAISKQVLMQTATKALNLKEDCSTEELEKALNKAIHQAGIAESELKTYQEKAGADIEELKAKLAKSEQANAELIAERDQALEGKRVAEEKTAAGKIANAEELKKLKSQLTDKQKEIKQITKILADTPENVVKKMKTLKKEKMDEANDRKRAEENSRTLRKDKQKVEQELKETQAVLEQASQEIGNYRELHKLANEQYNQLAEKVEDKDSLELIPAINEEVLEAIESAASQEDKDKDKGKKKDKKAKKDK